MHMWERGAEPCLDQGDAAAASAGTYTVQAVLTLRHLHAAGADAVAELLQMLLYLVDFPRKKNDGNVSSQ